MAGEFEASRIGTQFGRYRIDALIGRGGMGAVYRAYDTVHDRVVALKLLGGTGVDDGTFAERFRRECQSVARLGEPHIIPIHDFGEVDGVLYLDMRLVEGQNLRQVLRQRGPLPADEAVALVEQVGQALDAAHAAGLVHRDVKPENILVTPTGFAYLVDFGIAHDGADSGLTRTGTAIGSTAYLAPEQFDNAPVSRASDVYSLSAVLFELLAGRPPFAGDTVSAVIKATVLNDAPPVSSVNPNVPPVLDPVLACGLAKEPSQRFASAGELGIAAGQALRGGAVTTFIPVPAPVPAPVAAPGYAATAQAPMPQGYPGTQSYPGVQSYYSGPQGYPVPEGPAGPTGNPSRVPQLVLAGVIGLLIAALVGLGIYQFTKSSGGADQVVAESSTTTITSTISPTRGTPPPGSRACNDDVGVGTQVTSCAFAENVHTAYLAAGPKGQSRTVIAHSPVTGVSYTMVCAPQSGIVVCSGGNDAVVHIY